MNESILHAVLVLSTLGGLAAIILFVVSKKFYVYENPLIEEVEGILPSANCGGCGFPGCHNFAESLVISEDISDLFCPVAGNEVMQQISQKLGKEIQEKEPMVAVLLCHGTCDARPKTIQFKGPDSCSITDLIFAGETDCQYGCLGKGECVDACDFDAMYMDEETGLPVIITDKCTACGACIAACPRDLIEFRPKNKRDLKIYVACRNQEKGNIARKACLAACIGCMKCQKVCPKDAIDITNHLAYIDATLCTLCRKCVPVCPTDAIIETNFPPRKQKNESTTNKIKEQA